MDLKLFLEKLSSYKIFNHLFPGIIFAAIGTKLTNTSFLYDNILIGIFVYYFYGIVISRVGSILVEPFLKKIRFIEFAPYSEYVIASKVDDKIELFSEENNMYRTLISTFFCLFTIHIFKKVITINSFISDNSTIFALFFLIILFSFSYRKQTMYIKLRIQQAIQKNKETEKQK